MYQCTHNGWTKIICQECSKKKFAIITEARMLSSGTIATLINDSSYDAIDKARSDFIAWLMHQENLFANWQIAWNDFTAQPQGITLT